MIFLLLVVWPIAMSGSAWLVRRTPLLATLTAAIATLVELVLLGRVALDDPARLLGINVVVTATSQLTLGVLAVSVLVNLLSSAVFAQGEHVPAITLLLLGCGAAVAIFAAPLLATTVVLIAGGLAALLLLDTPTFTLISPALLAAALRFLVLWVVGAALLFVGLLLQRPAASPLATTLVVLGWAVLLGLFPFHLAFPPLAATANVAVIGVIGGVLQLLGVLLVIALRPTQLVADALAQQLLVAFGGLSVLGGALLALRATPRRTIMLLLTARLGLIAVALGQPTEVGLRSALALIATHALATALLVLGLALGERRVAGRSESVGILRERPLAAIACIAGLLTLLGLPPFGGWGPLLLLSQALSGSPVVLGCCALGLVIAALAATRLIRDLLIRPPVVATTRTLAFDDVQLLPAAIPGYAPGLVRIALIVLLTASLALGLAPDLLFVPLNAAGR